MNKLILAFLIAAFLLLIAPAQAAIYVGGEAGVPSISEAIEKATENETIIVSEGIYLENVVIDKPLILKASGNVTIEAADDSDFVVWIRANNVVFSGFNVTEGFAGISLVYVQGCRIENNSVIENDHGIVLFFSGGNKIENNTACENRDRGIDLGYSSGNEVRNNIVNKNLEGIKLMNSSNNKIKNNTACENGAAGIRLVNSSGNEVRNNTVCDNGIRGIHLQDSSENKVSNNIANKNLDGIGLMNSTNNKIENNTACENAVVGIYLQDSSENGVNYNIANKNTMVGIWLESESNNNIIRNNTASKNEQAGISISYSSENEVSNNIATGNLEFCIVLYNSYNNKIENNTACENGIRGIHLQDSSGNEVRNNIANKNRGGIRLINSNNNKIENNTACENIGWGIYLEDSSGKNEVRNNIVNKNVRGIVLINLGDNNDNNVIENNTACENEEDGIHLEDSSGNEVRSNIVNKNLKGIVSSSSNNNIITNNTACENGDTGIRLEGVENNEVNNNIFNKNLVGIRLLYINNNIITNNTACGNRGEGIEIGYSSGNEVRSNIANKNPEGIVLTHSNNNIITNNTASENDIGIHLYVSSGNEVRNNFVNKNSNGIVLLSSNENIITKNNIVNNKNQADIEDVTYTLYKYNNFDRNYWSDYTGEDKSKDGIGDEPYVIDEANKDRYPYMNYSGWLNVVITPEFWEFFAKKGDVINKNFSIENRLNRAIEVEVVLDKNLSFKSDLAGTETNKKTVSIPPKSTKNITLRLNTTNLEGYILRKVIFNTEEYTKITLVNGFVQPKLHKVKVEGVDFHRNVVKGQINPFTIILRNYGDKDEFKVNLRMGSEEKSRTVYLNETETRTIPFDIDTSKLPLGINKGEVVVSQDEMVDYLNLTLFVASKLEASTLVVTNLTRFEFKFNESEELRSELIRLTHHPAVNGILLDVSCNYTEFDSNYSKANKLCEAIKKQIEEKISEYPNVKYLIIVGDDHVIPFHRERDGTKDVFTVITGLPDEGDYSLISLPSNSVKNALSTNHFLTDDFYAHLAAGRVLAVGRLVEKPDEIIKAIDMFFNYYQLTPTNVFVTGYDFMYDGSEECFEAWRKRIGTTFKYKDKKSSNYASPGEIISEIFNSSVSAIFLHANYDGFEVPSGISVKREYLGVEEIRALNGSIIYTMGCHAGLTIPEVNDLSQTVLSNGTIAYIAPTGYGLGGVITVAGHEKLLEYLTKRIARGEEVGFAVMNAKNDYYLDNFNQDKLDEKVIRSLTLYGFPMYAVRLDSSIAAMSEDAELEEHAIKNFAYTVSNITLEKATLTLKPTFKVYETENGTYYSYQDISTEAGMPILPKATWYFIRGEKEIRGIALRSARFEVNETRLAIETFAVSDGSGSENELRGWYPTIPFTLNTIEDRQGIVTASAQYKYTEWPKKGIIRLFNEIVLDIFRVPVDAEKEKPVVNVSVDKDVTVKAEDNAGIYDVLITYLDSENNSWESKCLGHSDSERKRVEYSIPLNNTVFFVQAMDVNGNVKIDDNKGRYYVC